MTFETIRYEVRTGVAHMRLARPDRANAINPSFSRELEGVTITSAMARHDGREGVAAFVEKRRAHFTGN
jgi:enoyl-CoA hydratase/carnithine racemase